MGLLDQIRGWFQPVSTQPLSLAYALDMDANGRHLVRVYRTHNGEQEPVNNVAALLRYDFRERSPDGKTLYVVAPEDRQTLLSLQSLNPQQVDAHTLAFEITPPVLEYLRHQPKVAETPASQEITIIPEPLQPAAHIDFDPKDGLTIQAGYKLSPDGETIPASSLHPIGNSRYVRSGKTLAMLPTRLNPTSAKLLAQEVVRIPPDQIPEFFQRDLVLVKSDFDAVLTDRARQIRVVDGALPPVVYVDMQKPGWLDFKVDYDAQDRRFAHELLSAQLPGSTEGNTQFKRIDETTWIKPNAGQVNQVERELQQLGAQKTATGYRMPVSQFANLDDFVKRIGGKEALSQAYQQFIDQLTGFDADPNFTLAPLVEDTLAEHHIKLRPYQREGIHWLHWLQQNGLHGLLADDMGLGKTMQGICALAHAYLTENVQAHSLIVAPKSVLVHWQREVHRCIPNLRTHIYHGSDRDNDLHLFESPTPYLFISTYATVTNDIEHLSQVPFFYLILDEATYIKNPSAQRTQSIKALNAAHRLALSGTPIENRPAELWSLFDFLMRGHLGRYGTFQKKFEQPILEGEPEAAAALGARVRPFMLRRLKEDVAQDLPEKIPLTEWCELTEEQRFLYGSYQDAANQISEQLARGENVSFATTILPLLTKLKQICDHPALVVARKEPVAGRSEKFDLIVAKISEILAQGDQLVLFSHFLGMLNLVEDQLVAASIPYIRIDGSTEDRQSLMDRFNRSEAKVALCSLMAAGQGITLTAANHIIHADRWWNPAAEDQATDRVHRIGQTKTVYVYHFLTEGTLEERIDELLERKRDMADAVVSAAGEMQLQWTREELMEILKPLR